jgi:NAD(P)-dependent dehydrogenase (short-subunit alcohol dehydrogenase family)
MPRPTPFPAPVVEEIARRGGEAMSAVCDVTRPEQVEACVAATVDAFGTVDILVNNANVAPYGELLAVSDKAFELAFRVGPLAVLRFMQACHSHLAAGDGGGDGGVIVNLTSGSALRPHPLGLGAYAAVKDAISVLTRAAAVEWGPAGIRVVALMPFATSEGMDWWADHDPEGYARVLAEVPLRRIGDPEADIGRAAVWLCSTDASYVTGTTLVVDGGQSYLR